ncbi:MAG: ABC transporter substrate-binding protein, partial [Roseicyclus sp.]
LAQVGMEATLNAMPVSTYWPELREGNFDMFLLGWSPGTFDAEHPIRFLVHTAGERLGTWNFGGYSSARIDALLPVMQSELDPAARQAAMEEAAGIIREDVVYVPLYVQPLLWGVRDGVEVTQRPDNFLILRWVRM